MANNAADYIRKIESLLRLASDPSASEAEREQAQDRADAIMFNYRIDQAMLFKTGESVAREVVVKEYDPAASEEFRSTTSHIRANIFIHSGCMVYDSYRLTVVGYEEEIQMAEMLWSQVFLHFTRTVFPKWETHRTFDANVYDLKSAGYSWPYVREQGMKHDGGDSAGKLTAKNAGGKLRTAFKREANRRGVAVQPGKQQPMVPDKWRRSFADAYASKLVQRLADLKSKNEAEVGEAGVLALVSEQDRIQQQFYALFPDMNPEVQKRRHEEYKAAEEARWNALTDEEKKAEKDREYKASMKWARRASKQSSYYDDAGWNAGSRAAENADLGQGRVGASSGKELG